MAKTEEEIISNNEFRMSNAEGFTSLFDIGRMTLAQAHKRMNVLQKPQHDRPGYRELVKDKIKKFLDKYKVFRYIC